MSDEKKMQSQAALKTLRRFGVAMGAIGALLAIFGVYFLYIGNETLSWSAVEGSIVKAEVNTHVSLSKSTAEAAPIAYVEYYVSVQYSYEVEGDRYLFSRYSFGQGQSASRRYRDRAEAETEAASRFPEGAAITVHYDPEDPTEAVLETGWNWGTFTPLLMGLCFGGVGWLFYAVGRSADGAQESKI